MYSVLGSVCLSGVGVYFCVNYVKKEDIDKCFQKIDEKVTILEEQVIELVNRAGRQVDVFIDNIKVEVEELVELKTSDEKREEVVAIQLQLESISEEETSFEEFVILDEESSDECKNLLP